MSYEVKIINGIPKKIHQVEVHKFSVGDSEDPDLYAADPIYRWEQSEVGQYIMSKAVETPIWKRHTDITSYGTHYVIFAKLYEEDITYYTLRWK